MIKFLHLCGLLHSCYFGSNRLSNLGSLTCEKEGLQKESHHDTNVHVEGVDFNKSPVLDITHVLGDAHCALGFEIRSALLEHNSVIVESTFQPQNHENVKWDSYEREEIFRHIRVGSDHGWHIVVRDEQQEKEDEMQPLHITASLVDLTFGIWDDNVLASISILLDTCE